MITLDGSTYKIHGTKYDHPFAKFVSTGRGVTGEVLHLEAGVYQNEYDPTLICTTVDIQTLRASFAKVAPNNLLDFIDEEKMQWLAGAGSDDATHRYNTGVYFDLMAKPVPLTGKGYRRDNLFDVAIHLLCNSALAINPPA